MADVDGKMKKSFYLPELFRSNKFLFVLVLLFFLVNIAFNTIFPSEITPFYQWSLYDKPMKNQQTQSFLTIVYNGGKVLRFKHTWQEPQKLFLTNPMNLFIYLKAGHPDPAAEHFVNSWLPRHHDFQNRFPFFKNYNDDADLKKFPDWFKRYLAQAAGEDVRDIKVYQTTVVFSPNGTLTEAATTLIYQIP